MAKKKSADALLQETQAIGPRPKRTWFSELPQSKQDELNEIKALFNSGKYPGVLKSNLHAKCCEQFGLTISVPTFSMWLSK